MSFTLTGYLIPFVFKLFSYCFKSVNRKSFLSLGWRYLSIHHKKHISHHCFECLPVKTSARSRHDWFDFHLQVSPTKVQKVVGFDKTKHPKIKHFQETKSPFLLKNLLIPDDEDMQRLAFQPAILCFTVCKCWCAILLCTKFCQVRTFRINITGSISCLFMRTERNGAQSESQRPCNSVNGSPGAKQDRNQIQDQNSLAPTGIQLTVRKPQLSKN